jgi:hypothetical protein
MEESTACVTAHDADVRGMVHDQRVGQVQVLRDAAVRDVLQAVAQGEFPCRRVDRRPSLGS